MEGESLSRSRSMANGHVGLQGSLREQLAFAVRSIQWSYAISWFISSTDSRMLEWGDGYYNGDIKTRKTTQAVEYSSNQLGLQRSEQLRELFESLSAGESNPQCRRPSAALSPEDLTDTEWYFLVCMSFTFDIGQGLPGRSLATNSTIWLCNAHCADSKVFSRSLLAKSASMQTVVCIPYKDGVIELGVTELVLEDPNIVEHIKTSLLGAPLVVLSGTSKHATETAAEYYEKGNVCSPGNQQQLQDEPLMVDIMDGGTSSQMQSWQHMDDDETSNCIHNSIDSSDCISQNLEEINDSLVEIQESNQKKESSHDLPIGDIHYQSVLSTLLKGSHQLALGPYFQNIDKASSFVTWKKKEVLTSNQMMPHCVTPQRLLKKVLAEVARMHRRSCSIQTREQINGKDDLQRGSIGGIDKNHLLLTERKRREKMKERFETLGSLVPSSGKIDKASLLDATIGYLKELGEKIEKLESCKERADTEVRKRKRAQDSSERMSGNCCSNGKTNSKRPKIKVRKDGDMNILGAGEGEENSSMCVTMVEDDVVIEIKCPWRDELLLDIMDAVRSLQLDSHFIQSSILDGVLSLTSRSKRKGSAVASKKKIRQVLQGVIQKH